MSELQAIADRIEIEALRGEFTDAGMMRDYGRFASLFTQDGAWRIPDINVEFVCREEIRAGIERLQSLWDYFVQTAHPGTIQLEGDTAVGRTYIAEFGRMRDGSSHLNYSVYHDRYQRTLDGWKFTERVDEVRYLDTTPLGLSAPRSDGVYVGWRAIARPAPLGRRRDQHLAGATRGRQGASSRCRPRSGARGSSRRR